ncbi:MAG: alpha/beta hydrolase [Dehalococcoidia bacterium]|nr:alpha/beta hydrolase [Dehalococcoidia bacterium]
MLFCRPENLKGCIQAGDIAIYYHSYGRGDPVLLLHGGFMCAESWAGQIPALARDYRVIAADSRGHGRSTLGEGPLTYRRMAGDAAGLIERLRLSPVHLIGWSDGGCIGLALAVERPELVRSLTLLGTPYSTANYTERAKKKIERLLHPRSVSMLATRVLRRCLTPEPKRGREFVGLMARMWTELPDFTREELGRIEAPVLVIGCDRDEFLSLGPDPLHVFRETAEAIPHARMEVVKGGTHNVHIERPEAVNRLILDFLREAR